jgi:hypothetical protein
MQVGVNTWEAAGFLGMSEKTLRDVYGHRHPDYLQALICRINARRSVSIYGRPPQTRFPTPIKAKAGPMPPHECFRLNDRNKLQDRRKPTIQLDKEPAVVAREPDPARHLAAQNDQLMAERSVLCLKPAFRLEWRGQNRQDEPAQSKHDPERLRDSGSQSMRIRFLVHTATAIETLRWSARRQRA